MSQKHYTQIVLNERPIADTTPTTFRIEKAPFSLKPGAGEILVRVTWLSLDPAMRGWLSDARSYILPVQIGEVMRSLGLATVVQAFTNLGRWISEGRIIHKFQVVEGLEKAPESLPLLFSGGNIGKLVVHVSGPRADL